MILDHDELMRISGYKRHADLRRYVMEAGWDLLPAGKGGRVAAIIRERGKRRGEPNFAALAQERREAG